MPKEDKGIISDLVDDMESLAMDFQAALYNKNLVKDRKFGLIAYPEAFVGRDAVDVLLECLQELNEEVPGSDDSAISRENALVIGRAMAETYQLFESAFRLKKIDHELCDDRFHFYKWKNNLPSDVAQITYQMPLKQKVMILKKYVPIKDRFFRLKTYARCFVGSDAVDVLMKQRIVVSRKEGVHLIRQMKKEFACFYTIVSDKTQTFDDGSHCYYRFKMDEQIMKHRNGAKDLAFHCVIDALTGNEGNTAEFNLTSQSFSQSSYR